MSGFLDTSMVVWYLVRDVPDMADRAATIIDSDEDLLISGVAFAEIDHVLRSVYNLPREAVIEHLMAFVGKRNMHCHRLDKGTVLEALLMCRPSGRVSISDALIWAAARTSGQNLVYSFDARFPTDGIEVKFGP